MPQASDRAPGIDVARDCARDYAGDYSGESARKSAGESVRGPRFAQVLIDRDVAHLDRAFDYSIPPSLRGQVQLGSLVRVPFARKLTSGWVVGVSEDTSFKGKVAAIQRLVVPVPLFTSGLLSSSRYLALRFGATLSQVLSFIAPSRRASVEKELLPVEDATVPTPPSLGEGGGPRRGVLTVLPHQELGVFLAAAQSQKEAGRSTLLVVPTAEQSSRYAALLRENSDLRVGVYDAQSPPDRRYRTYLKSRLGQFDVVVGTRSTVWLSPPNLGGIVVWDSGDDRLREPRSPRFDALDVALARSHHEGLDLLVPAYSRSVKAEALAQTGWATGRVPSVVDTTRSIPKIEFFDLFDQEAEGPSGRMLLPSAAYRTIRAGLTTGSVLVQVAAAGYLTEVTDQREGPAGGDTYTRKGAERIAEEVQRAFPEATVVASTASATVLREVAGQGTIVVATPGAEPQAQGGYGSVVIAQSQVAVYREELDAPLEALRRWMNALALARPLAPALVIGSLPPELAQALSAWRAEKVAEQVWQERVSLGFPPARHVVELLGPPRSVDAALQEVGDHADALELTTMGRAEVSDGDLLEGWALVSVPASRALALMELLAEVRMRLSKSRRTPLKIHVNPPSMAPPQGALPSLGGELT